MNLQLQSLRKSAAFILLFSVPQYDEQMLKVERQLKRLKKSDIYICANWFGGVSVADCIKKGRDLALQFIADSNL